MNVCCVMFLIAALSGMFIEHDAYGRYLLILYAGCGITIYSASRRRSFLFLLYACIAGYIGTTYLLIDMMDNIVSCYSTASPYSKSLKRTLGYKNREVSSISQGFS